MKAPKNWLESNALFCFLFILFLVFPDPYIHAAEIGPGETGTVQIVRSNITGTVSAVFVGDAIGTDAQYIESNTSGSFTQNGSTLTITFQVTLTGNAPTGETIYPLFMVMIISNQAISNLPESVTIHVAGLPEAPTANFTATPNQGYSPLSVSFTNTSSGSINSYLWDFGDGSTSTVKNPSHTFTNVGQYSVKLVVTGSEDADSLIRTNYITVKDPTPVADFVADVTQGDGPLTVHFQNNSTGNISSYFWDFGDGNVSSIVAPSHTYNTKGKYTVSLIATGPTGSDTKVIIDYITVTSSYIIDPAVIFDPVTFNPDLLPFGMDIVYDNGVKYLQVFLDEWNSYLDIGSFNLTEEYTHFHTTAKYKTNGSGFTVDEVKTFFKLTDLAWTTDLAFGSFPSSPDFTEYDISILNYGSGNLFQVAGQDIYDFNPVSSDILLIGKIRLVDMARPIIRGSLNATVEGSSVSLNWEEGEDNAGIAGYFVFQNDIRLDSVDATAYTINNVQNGTYNFSVQAVDPSGNLSKEKTVSITVGPDWVENTRDVSFSIYPNPANKSCIIEFASGHTRIVKILAVNSNGQNVWNLSNGLLPGSGDKLELDLSNLQSGIYYLSIISESSITTRKLAIAR
jgi:PKD repeat protein